MDPITASLLAALLAAVKARATGAMADALTKAVKERAARLRGVIAEKDEAKFAQRMVDEIVAEAAQYPPETALLVRPLGTVGSVGIYGPRGTLRLNVLWVNRADFPIYVRDVRVTGKVGGQQNEWDAKLGDEFTLGPRRYEERDVELEPRHEVPTIERGTNCDVSISALVAGPWDEGQAQQTRNLVPLASIWLPAYNLEPASTLLTEVADVDLAIKHYVTQIEMKVRDLRTTSVTHERVSYADLDRTLGLRHGASKERLEVVVKQMGQHVESGPTVALIRVHDSLQVRSVGGFVIERNEF